MKKIALLLLLIPIIGFSQEKIDSYFNSAANETFDISIGKANKNEVFTYYFDCKSVDFNSKQSVIFIESNKINDFIDYINYLKDIHTKWSQTATENNVSELIKDIEYKNIPVRVAFSYGDWQFSSTTLKATFKILQGKHYIIINNSRRLVSATNQFMKSDGFMFSFNKAEDFQDIIEKLNNNESFKILNDIKAKDDLFKN